MVRDTLLVRCKKAIETLTVEIELQKRANQELQSRSEQYSQMINDLQEQQSEMQQQLGMQDEELNNRDH